ncbi:MAG: helix-turn-helix transcriptional regulator [Planctomycetota bacterium]
MGELLEKLRNAIETSGQSRYRISKQTGVAESVLSRFTSGETRLSIETAERLAEYLGHEIVLRPKRDRGARKGR